VYERVRSGSALSEAFEAQGIFSGVYTASLMAGEKSGSLEQVLRRLRAARQGHARRAIARDFALIYPAVLLALSGGRGQHDCLQGHPGVRGLL
jgi:type II secretory pathway component PulF